MNINLKFNTTVGIDYYVATVLKTTKSSYLVGAACHQSEQNALKQTKCTS